MTTRDMTRAQFLAALERHGMRPEGFLGYVDLGIPGHLIAVSRFNAGKNRRAQLAYLLRSREKYEQQIEAENAARGAA